MLKRKRLIINTKYIIILSTVTAITALFASYQLNCALRHKNNAIKESI